MAALREQITALQNRRAVLLCNLKPAKMKGIESQAMVLAASDADHTKVELLMPPEGVPPSSLRSERAAIASLPASLQSGSVANRL